LRAPVGTGFVKVSVDPRETSSLTLNSSFFQFHMEKFAWRSVIGTRMTFSPHGSNLVVKSLLMSMIAAIPKNAKRNNMVAFENPH